MGLLTKSRTLSDDTEEKKGKGGFLNGLLRMGKYAKTDAQKQEIKNSRSLPSRLGELRLKRYNRQMSFRFNDNKNRIEVGENFTMNKLPEIIYLLADGSTIFRKAIGGSFGLSEREKLRRIIRRKRNRIQKMERRLNNGVENRQQVYLKDLF